MSRMHILSSAGLNLYNVVVHAPVPAGNNTAGVSWKTAIANSGIQPASVLPTGNGPGQITTAEANQVTGGDLIEAPFQWGDDPAWDNPTRIADLNTRAGQAVAEVTARFRDQLKYFGYTVA